MTQPGGGKRRVTLGEVASAIAEANKILRQKAVALTPPETIETVNHPDWLIHENALANSATLLPMFMHSPSVGMLKPFYVDEVRDGARGGDPLGGVCLSHVGIALRKTESASSALLAHETMHHYGGLHDVYIGGGPHSVSGPPSRERLPLDWPGVFYPFRPETLSQRSLITRLLMNGDATGTVFPFGSVHGVGRGSVSGAPVGVETLVPVGQQSGKGALAP